MEWMLYILSDQFPVKDASFENLLFFQVPNNVSNLEFG